MSNRAGASRRSTGAFVLLAVAVLAAWAHRGALGAFFTTDDLILFERLRGIVPWPWTIWRLVSGRLYYLLAFPGFGTNPLPWHVINLALHALNAALVSAWAMRLGLRGPAALLSGGLFAVSASALTVTWSMSAIGELLACAAALAGLLALSGERVRAPWAWAAFGIGLLCKESIALVPLAALLAPQREATATRLRAAAPALAAGALLWGYVLMARDATGSLQGEAYAFGLGAHVLANVRDYAAWALDRIGTSPPTGVVAPTATAAGLVALAGMAWAAVTLPAAAAGLALFALALLPVLPLSHHTYIHYLYLPFAGWCVALAAALEGLAGRRSVRAEAWVAAGVLVFLALIGGSIAIQRVTTVRTPDAIFRLDTFVRRMDVSRNAWETLARELPADADELVIVRPAESRRALSVRTGQVVANPDAAAPAYDLMAGVLDEGRGLRALFPRLREVRFADVLAPADSVSVLATATLDGRLGATGRGPAAAARIADIWMNNRMPRSTAELLRSALRIWPGQPELEWRLAAVDSLLDRR